MQTAKIFKHGNSQVVRLPKEFRFDGDEVAIKRTASGVLLMPKKITLAQIDTILEQFAGRFVRKQLPLQKRNWR